jgi:hypothetical protein
MDDEIQVYADLTRRILGDKVIRNLQIEATRERRLPDHERARHRQHT